MDTLATIITLLKPQAVGTKIIRGAGRWGVRYPAFEQPSFALMLQGSCLLTVDGMPAITLETSDFILFPAMPGFAMRSDPEAPLLQMKPAPSEEQVEEIFHGGASAEPSVTMLGGYFAFDPINASMLLNLLPKMLRLHPTDPAGESVAVLVELIQREARKRREGRALVLARLIEVMLVEALRSDPVERVTTGLLAGLRDAQLAAALRGMHTRTTYPWTLATLAREAAMSRSSFAERFAGVVGITPLDYLLQWRLALAKNMMAHERKSVAETALAVGYESASGFSTAFSREVGVSPREFIRMHRNGNATIRDLP